MHSNKSSVGTDVKSFITANMQVRPVPHIPELSLYKAHPGSGLWRIVDPEHDNPPYWAYHWAGGAVLARHILDQPETVRGMRVLDLGSGSGVVGIAAAKAGASEVIAADTDANAIAATKLNARINGVRVKTILADLTIGDPPRVDLIAIGDLFYNELLARKVTEFLRRCADAGIEVLVGDPGRTYLPRSHLRLVAQYHVSDFADGAQVKPSSVFSFESRSEINID